MISELSFLIELLLNHKLPTATKQLVKGRIEDVEKSYSTVRPVTNIAPRPLPAGAAIQAASTQAILDRNPDLANATYNVAPIPVPVEQIAQTQATANALASRAAAINQAMSGNPEKGRTSPRKF